MILIALSALLLSISWTLHLPDKLSDYSVILHHFCLRSLPQGVENLASLETLVCGKNMQDMQLQQLLVQSSLIHIFIVSGSHFLLLHKILATVFGKRPALLLPLFLYAMITLCQPPSVRSLLFLVLIEIARRKKFFLSSLMAVLVSGLLSLALFPEWIHSRSFLMSLMAALAIAAGSEFLKNRTGALSKLFLTQSFLYLVMGFCLWGFSNLHPLSILMNLTLGPLIGAVLFPLGLLIVVLPFLSPLFDGILNLLFWILQKSSELTRTESLASPLALALQWAVFLALLLVAHHFTVRHWRKTYEI
jgi:ComEC/Rec2-related protein